MGIMAASNGYEAILQQIEAIRERMTGLGDQYGLSDPIVIGVSRELDTLIVHYHDLKRNE